MTKTKKTNSSNFETAMQELENIVTKMEQGNLSLEDSLKLFERGISLTSQCQQTLKKSEQQVKILLEKNSTAQLSTFSEENSNDES